jgi:hypothetical protein
MQSLVFTTAKLGQKGYYQAWLYDTNGLLKRIRKY